MSDVAIGIDVGGTTIAGGIVGADGMIASGRSEPTPRTSRGGDPGATATIGLVEELLAVGAEHGPRPIGIGIGVPEYVTPAGRISSREVLDWPPDAIAATAWPVPVVIESDVRCAALAEQRFGLGRQLDSFLFVSIGTGVSHTLVVDGRIWPGHRGEALALGELPVATELMIRPDAPATVEQQASGRAIEHALRRGQEPRWVVGTAGRIMAEALMMAVRLVDPQALVLGGGLGTSDGPFIETLREHYAELGGGRPGQPPIRRSAVGVQGGVVGAGLVALGR